MLAAASLELKAEKQSAHSGYVRSVAFSPDGKTIVSGSDDQTIKVWVPKADRALSTRRAHLNVPWFSYQEHIIVVPVCRRALSIVSRASRQLRFTAQSRIASGAAAVRPKTPRAAEGVTCSGVAELLSSGGASSGAHSGGAEQL